MKERVSPQGQTSRTPDAHSRAANQAPISEIIQSYKNRSATTVQRETLPEEDELLQGKFDTAQREALPDEEEEPIQQKPENKTGLPDDLKAGVEAASGFSMDDVRVHYNSPKPAQLQALAYAQGSEIHVGPGQEQHLPHEAWHVVQQKQGRVQPTMQMQGVSVNDDEGLEREADVMGMKSVTQQVSALDTNYKALNALDSKAIQLKRINFKDGIIVELTDSFMEKHIIKEGENGHEMLRKRGIERNTMVELPALLMELYKLLATAPKSGLYTLPVSGTTFTYLSSDGSYKVKSIIIQLDKIDEKKYLINHLEFSEKDDRLVITDDMFKIKKR